MLTSSFNLRTLIPVLAVILLCTCQKEEDIVDIELVEYLSRFQDEAKLRGITIDYRERPIEARLELHDQDVNLGWCNYDIKQPKIIFNTLFWSILDDLDKEKLVFHELGHCILSRDHLDDQRADDRCKSIMHSGQVCSDDYSLETRQTYLDELFLR